MAVALLLATAPPPPGADALREAWAASYVARHRDEACGMHWSGNPVHPQCLAQLAHEGRLAFDSLAGQPRR